VPEDRPLVYMEDVGRHNAVDKIAGWMHVNSADPSTKIFYTTGRLTSEMVIKTAMMGIPILVSRSGFTAWGVDLARQVGLTLIGRARGERFIALSGTERIIFDATPSTDGEAPMTTATAASRPAMPTRPQNDRAFQDCRRHPCRWAGAPHGRRRQTADQHLVAEPC
jgi:FdhD protein